MAIQLLKIGTRWPFLNSDLFSEMPKGEQLGRMRMANAVHDNLFGILRALRKCLQ